MQETLYQYCFSLFYIWQ